MLSLKIFTGRLLHTFHPESKPGWSPCQGTCIDIAKVKGTSSRRRLFCFLDREHPYTLTINYSSEKSQATVQKSYVPFIPLVIPIFLEDEKDEGTTYITRRYPSFDLCQEEMQAIRKKQDVLNGHLKIYNDDLEMRLDRDFN